MNLPHRTQGLKVKTRGVLRCFPRRAAMKSQRRSILPSKKRLYIPINAAWTRTQICARCSNPLLETDLVDIVSAGSFAPDDRSFSVISMKQMGQSPSTGLRMSPFPVMGGLSIHRLSATFCNMTRSSCMADKSMSTGCGCAFSYRWEE